VAIRNITAPKSPKTLTQAHATSKLAKPYCGHTSVSGPDSITLFLKNRSEGVNLVQDGTPSPFLVSLTIWSVPATVRISGRLKIEYVRQWTTRFPGRDHLIHTKRTYCLSVTLSGGPIKGNQGQTTFNRKSTALLPKNVVCPRLFVPVYSPGQIYFLGRAPQPNK
jgi:hypothetical protein